MGGFILPWLEELGENIPLFDFRVPGVTSMSADIHKYGFAAKGASVVLYKSMKYMKHQFFITASWPGGVYASPNFPGTRPGGAIAAAWATLKKFGREGYLSQTRRSMEARAKFMEGVKSIKGLEICGDPKTPVIAFESVDEGLSAYAIADLMAEKGWFFDRVQEPQAIHLTIMPVHNETADAFVADLKECAQIVRENPELAKSGDAAMYGMMAKVPVKGLVKKTVESVMESMWGPEGKAPDLENAGKAEDASLIMKLADQYGPKGMEIYEKIEKKAKKIKDMSPFNK